jgi:hypothetical protein
MLVFAAWFDVDEDTATLVARARAITPQVMEESRA